MTSEVSYAAERSHSARFDRADPSRPRPGSGRRSEGGEGTFKRRSAAKSMSFGFNLCLITGDRAHMTTSPFTYTEVWCPRVTVQLYQDTHTQLLRSHHGRTLKPPP